MIIIACAVLEEELGVILPQLNTECTVLYLDSALHIDDDRLYAALTERLEEAKATGGRIGILMGYGCHPRMREIAAKYGAKLPEMRNCLELLIGPKMRELNDESESYFLSQGWMKNWREVLTSGQNWDEVDARQNFGYFDRAVFIDTGVGSVPEETFFDFFEFTQTPIEPYETNLEHLKQQVLSLLEQ